MKRELHHNRCCVCEAEGDFFVPFFQSSPKTLLLPDCWLLNLLNDFPFSLEHQDLSGCRLEGVRRKMHQKRSAENTDRAFSGEDVCLTHVKSVRSASSPTPSLRDRFHGCETKFQLKWKIAPFTSEKKESKKIAQSTESFSRKKKKWIERNERSKNRAAGRRQMDRHLNSLWLTFRSLAYEGLCCKEMRYNQHRNEQQEEIDMQTWQWNHDQEIRRWEDENMKR